MTAARHVASDGDATEIKPPAHIIEGFGMDRRQLLRSTLALGGSLLGGGALLSRAASGGATTAPLG